MPGGPVRGSHRRGRAPAASLDTELPGHGRRSLRRPAGGPAHALPQLSLTGTRAATGPSREGGGLALPFRPLIGRLGGACRLRAAVRSSRPVRCGAVPSRSGIPGRMVSAPSPPRAPFPPPPPPSPSGPSRRQQELCKSPSGSTPAQAVAAARLPRTTHPGEAPPPTGKTIPEKHRNSQNTSPALVKAEGTCLVPLGTASFGPPARCCNGTGQARRWNLKGICTIQM